MAASTKTAAPAKGAANKDSSSSKSSISAAAAAARVAAAGAVPAKVAAKVAAPLMATAPAKVAVPVHQSSLKQQRCSSRSREGVSRTTAAGASMETGAAGPANGSSSKQQF